jgi:hypothetical protein
VGLHGYLYDARNGHKAELVIEKCANRDLVGSVQHHRRRAAGPERRIRQAEAGEAIVRRFEKFEAARTRQVERRQRAVPPLRIRTGVLDGQPHVGDSELRHHGPVNQFHKRMHD